MTETVKIKGDSFNGNGELVAIWESIATCINPSQRLVFYYWKGWHPIAPNDPYEGFGQISFHESLHNGFGVFSDTNLTDWKTTTRKSVIFERISDPPLSPAPSPVKGSEPWSSRKKRYGIHSVWNSSCVIPRREGSQDWRALSRVFLLLVGTENKWWHAA